MRVTGFITRIALFLGVCAWSVPVRAQWMEMWNSEMNPRFLRLDDLHGVYAVGESEIVKYDAQGTVKYRYSDNSYGPIGSVDVSFPLRPMVFYPDLGAMLLLDNTLSLFRGPIYLTEKGFSSPVLACASVQNHFWVYDETGSNLVRLSDRFDKVTETGNLSRIFGKTLVPNGMREVANRLYLKDPKWGILVFDLFGTYIKTIPLPGLSGFGIDGEAVLYFDRDTLRQYDTRLHTTRSTPLPRPCGTGMVRPPYVVAMCGNKVYMWKWTGGN